VRVVDLRPLTDGDGDWEECEAGLNLTKRHIIAVAVAGRVHVVTGRSRQLREAGSSRADVGDRNRPFRDLLGLPAGVRAVRVQPGVANELRS
jgi:hypothetical protein